MSQYTATRQKISGQQKFCGFFGCKVFEVCIDPAYIPLLKKILVAWI